MNENELMGSMKVSKAVAKMAIPSVISSPVKYGNAPVAAIVLSMCIWGRKKKKLKSE